MGAVAQPSSGTTNLSERATLLLPDGKILKNDKLDSLAVVWGEGRIVFSHNEKDDAKGIVHLVRMTDEMKKKSEDQDAESEQILSEMLDNPAPDFELKDLQGKLWSIKELRGKVVVLNFWFTSCPPCIQEMPELNKLVQEYDGENIVFLGLAFNNAEQIKTFLNKHAFSYTLLTNSTAVDKKYHVNSWPTSFVIDRGGIIRSVIKVSSKIGEDLKSIINALN
jgi:peroxiredoxin